VALVWAGRQASAGSKSKREAEARSRILKAGGGGEICPIYKTMLFGPMLLTDGAGDFGSICSRQCSGCPNLCAGIAVRRRVVLNGPPLKITQSSFLVLALFPDNGLTSVEACISQVHPKFDLSTPVVYASGRCSCM